jgi:hypothetical protein
MRCLFLFSLAALSTFAQTGSVGFPALGFAPDPRSSQIRPIRGIPGAALLGDPLDTSTFTNSAISPKQDLALAVSAADGQLYLVPLSGEPARAVANAMSGPSQIVFSPTGRAAIIRGGRLQILNELAGAPRVTEVALDPFDTPPALAVSDDGQAMLASSGRDENPVWLAGPGGSLTQLPLPGSVRAIAFRRDSRDAVAVTRSGDVYLVRNAGPDAEIRQVYIGDEQTSDPVAVQISPDGSRAFTANSHGLVAAIHLQSGSVASASCQCAPVSLEPMNAPALYRLTEISDLPVMLFDASTLTPRIWFVPAGASASSLQRSAQ